MVETDKLQSEVRTTYYLWKWALLTNTPHPLEKNIVSLDIEFEEAAGSERPGSEGEGQTGT